MKRWMKGFTIAGVIMIFAGTGISALAGVAGGISSSQFGIRPFRNVVDHVIFRNNSGYFPFGGWGDDYDDDYDDYDYDDDFDDDSAYADGHNSVPIGENGTYSVISLKEDMKQMGSYKGITKLELDLENAAVKVVENPELTDEVVFYMKDKERSSFHYKEKEEGATGISVTYRSSGRNLTHAEGIVEIPVGYKFDKAELDVAAGELLVSSIMAKTLKLDVEAGTINVQAFEADTLDMDVAAGEVRAKGAVNLNLEAEVGAGSIVASLKGKERDFQYHFECAMGNIRIGGTEYSGLAMEQRLNSGAGKTAELDCNMGNIEVTFY